MRLVRGRRRRRGVTLLEALLAVGLSILLLSSLASLLVEGQRELKARNEAEQLQSFQRAAAQYFLARRAAMLRAMEPGEDRERDPDRVCPLRREVRTQSPRVVCGIDAAALLRTGFLPPSFSPHNTFGEPLVAVFRRSTGLDGALGDDVEMLAVALFTSSASEPSAQRQATSLSAASLLGASGGVLPTRDNPGRCGANNSEGSWACGNGWEVQLEAFGLSLPPPGAARGDRP